MGFHNKRRSREGGNKSGAYLANKYLANSQLESIPDMA